MWQEVGQKYAAARKITPENTNIRHTGSLSQMKCPRNPSIKVYYNLKNYYNLKRITNE